MMLTDDTMSKPTNKNEKPVVTEEGNRTLAEKFFDATGPADNPATRNQLLNLTVRLRTKQAPFHIGSGVILFTTSKGKTVILTAKHVLYTLSNQKAPNGKKPADFNNKTFCDSIEIGYAPAALLGAPAQTAAVTAVNFLGVCDDQTWKYDLVALESTDENFLTHANACRFITPDKPPRVDLMNQLVFKKDGKGSKALNAGLFELFQMGYGIGRVPDVETEGTYTDYEGRIQCKQSSPKANSPLAEVFEIERKKKSADWPKSEQICLLDADVTSSNAPGDSGGPLFCRSKKNSSKFYLVGITSGMNFFSDEKYTKENAELPRDKLIHNNGVTYWLDVFKAIGGAA